MKKSTGEVLGRDDWKMSVFIEDFDVLGHLDYMVRYGKDKEQAYSYLKYADADRRDSEKVSLQTGKGLELNMAGLKYGLAICTSTSRMY